MVERLADACLVLARRRGVRFRTSHLLCPHSFIDDSAGAGMGGEG